MRILLISPSWKEPLLKSRKPRNIFPNLGLAMVAALTPDRHDVRILDEAIEPLDFETKVDLVGISVMTNAAPRAYRIADEFRARRIPVVMGGMHPSALPEEALQHADSVVVGEAEPVWSDLLSDLEAGNLKQVYKSNGTTVLDSLPTPRRDLIDTSRYLIPHSVQTTRGCPFNCSFCSVTTFFGRSFRFRPVDEVVREVRELPGKLVAFIDDNIAGAPNRAKQLFKALIPLKKRWLSQASLNIAKDDELLELAARSGCLGMFVGFESLAADNLKSVGKVVNKAEEYYEAVRKLKSYGLGVFGAFIFGFDNDDESVFERTVRFARQVGLGGAQFAILTPYPGTRLYDQMEKEGRIFEKDWAKFSASRVVFWPKNMSPKTLQEGFEWAWKEFYSAGSIIERLGRLRSNLGFWLALNSTINRMAHNLPQIDFEAPAPVS